MGAQTMNDKSDLSVLIVDDNEINLMLMEDVLETIGIIDVKTLENGLKAVEEIEKNANYDIILMDISMPVMDGYEASKKIRSLGYDGRIIALTASGISKTNLEFLEAKMDDCILKPVDIEVVQKVLCSH